MLDYPLDLIARVLEGRLHGPAERLVRRVCIDSRKVEPGDLFFALSGERFDAHQFVPEVLEKGAVGAVTARGRIAVSRSGPGGAVIEVEDPLLALGTLGAWHRSRFPVRLVGVTGSVGKTTTKDLVAAVLGQQYTTLKSPGNLNAEIGLPLTLLQLGSEHKAAVVEMAMRGPGQIRYLARLARPEVAVITTIGLSHIELLGSQDAIADAKAEILDFLPVDGTAVLNADDRYYSFLRSRVPPGARVLPFGTGTPEGEGIYGAYLGSGPPQGERDSGGHLGARFTLRSGRNGVVRWVWMPILGRHNMQNALAAAAVGQALGVSWPRIARALAEAEVSGMRMEVHRLKDGSSILDDAYNASSPEAMLSALQVLHEIPGLRTVAVLADMLELGPMSEPSHTQVGEGVASTRPDLLVTVGERAAKIAETAVASGFPEEGVLVCATREEALDALRPLRRPGDVILVKGSRGMAMEHLVRGLREDAGA